MHACPEGLGVRIYELMKALRVLVIEDDALIAMLLAELLACMGHDVCATAATEAEAGSAAARCRPGLMILDAGFGPGRGVAALAGKPPAGPAAPPCLRGGARPGPAPHARPRVKPTTT